MTIPLEHIQEGDWAAVNRVVDVLRSLVFDTGGVSLGIRVGTGTATWTASNISAAVTVTHGLGTVPVYARPSSRAAGIDYAVTARSTTTITVSGFTTAGGATTQSQTFDWVVIG